MPKTYLALDYGAKRTGLAVGNDLTHTSQAIDAIATSLLHHKNGEIVPNALQDIIQTWRIKHLILGAPLDENSLATMQSKKIKKIGIALGKALNLPISFADERYTSSEANHLLREQQTAGKRFTKKQILKRDSLAAQLILDAYFAQN